MVKFIHKIKNSLSTKIFLGVLFTLTFICLLIFGSMRVFMPKILQSEQNTAFTKNLYKLASDLETIPKEEIQLYINSFALENQANVDIYDEKNNVVFSTNLATVDDTNTSSNSNQETTIRLNFQNNGQTLFLNTSLTTNNADKLIGTFGKIFPYTLIAIIILSLLVAWLYTNILAKPIVNISNISKKMATLDLTWRCNIKRSDEIGVLAKNMNQMAYNLNNTLYELKTANEKLQEDIAWEKRQEKQRKDFFAAISHELKTPVAILKGELEGMICNIGKFKDRDTYLQEAYETTESIEKLVKEIMSLVKINIEEMKPNKEKIVLNQMITECCKTYEDITLNKNISIEKDIDPSITCYADYNNFKKAISNILGNAVYHSPEESFIKISLKRRNNKGVLNIENSGAHIDEEEMKRIFEPFYRVDKSRSRHTGGSGLGMYITKNILEMHNFEYTFKNTNSGVSFRIIFPLYK